MSYRSLKRLLGETSLERKCLFLFGTFLLIVITSVFWYYSYRTDDLVLDATRRTANGLKGTILVREHLKVLTVPEDLERNEVLYRELGEEATDHTWDFFRPGLSRSSRYEKPLDDKEKEVLERFTHPAPDDQGWDERRAHDTYQYFLPIRATKKKCVDCHRSLHTDQVNLEVGDLMAVMEIVIPDVE